MQIPLVLKAVKLVLNDSQPGEWPSSNSETLRWVDTGHSDGVMRFESDTLNAMIAENRRLRDRVEAFEWLREVTRYSVAPDLYHAATSDGVEEMHAILAAARAAVEVE